MSYRGVSANISDMRFKDQSGMAAAGLLIVVMVVLLLGAIGFGAWAYSGMQDYKTNTNQKIADAVSQAKQQEDAIKDAQYAEAAKNPLQAYTGPSAYGSVTINYPKSWDVYDNGTSNNGVLMDVYFHPAPVPPIDGDDSVFALRIQVLSDSYSDSLAQYDRDVEKGVVSVSPYQAAKVPGVVGSMVKGQIEDGLDGSMIILPLRDKTLEIWTESTTYEADFDNLILPNFSFSP